MYLLSVTKRKWPTHPEKPKYSGSWDYSKEQKPVGYTQHVHTLLNNNKKRQMFPSNQNKSVHQRYIFVFVCFEVYGLNTLQMVSSNQESIFPKHQVDRYQISSVNISSVFICVEFCRRSNWPKGDAATSKRSTLRAGDLLCNHTGSEAGTSMSSSYTFL